MSFLLDKLQGESPMLQLIGKWATLLHINRYSIGSSIHLLLAALFPIIIGAHASLQRPPSAGPPEKKNENEEDDEVTFTGGEQLSAGLDPSDAFFLPLTAAVILGGLYGVIVWLKRADLVNLFMKWYISFIGVFGVGRLFADSLNIFVTFIFPSVWSSGEEAYYVESLLCQQVSGKVNKSRTLSTRTNPTSKNNPFPGLLSSIKFPNFITKKLWSLRAAFKNHLVLRAYVYGMTNGSIKVFLNHAIGLVLGVVTIILFHIFPTRTWWLTNIIGTTLCYNVPQVLSPTTFWTGTLILASLFVYDIVMVFYTPLMITVAQSIEAPIMLVIPGPGRGTMLGLGDIALPSIVMAMALRFDLHLHYLKKQKIQVAEGSDNKKIIKVPYQEATGVWGERFWTRRGASTIADAARFPKIYFTASIIGYILAMFVTGFVMYRFKHAQPALLYLVPGVLGSLWGTALVRGELKLMWEYKENGEWGFEDEVKARESKKEGVKDEKSNGEVGTLKAMRGFMAGNGANGMELSMNSAAVAKGDEPNEKVAEKTYEKKKDNQFSRHFFLLELITPKSRKNAMDSK